MQQPTVYISALHSIPSTVTENFRYHLQSFCFHTRPLTLLLTRYSCSHSSGPNLRYKIITIDSAVHNVTINRNEK